MGGRLCRPGPCTIVVVDAAAAAIAAASSAHRFFDFLVGFPLVDVVVWSPVGGHEDGRGRKHCRLHRVIE